MNPFPFAEPSDVAGIWRPLTAQETVTATGLIAQASAKLTSIAREAGIDIQAYINGDALRIELAKVAVANAVKRVLQNPEAVLSTSFAIDDYKQDDRRDSTVSTGALYIDDADLGWLIKPKPSSRWGTIAMKAALQ